ncbi:MAG: SGNH/GDSL hydrolase family protein [Victivallales bacterium]|jgi:lysophospholipase L1-like esterase
MKNANKKAKTAIALTMLSMDCASGSVVDFKLTGDWQVTVEVRTPGSNEKINEIRAVIDLLQPISVNVENERYDKLPEFNPKAWGWKKGVALNQIKAQECTTCFALNPESIKVAAAVNNDAVIFEKGKDYEADINWGSVGFLPEGRIKPDQEVFISYQYTPQRIDSIVLTLQNELILKHGTSEIAVPKPPELIAGEQRIMNIYTSKKIKKLDLDNLYPILETIYPEPSKPSPTIAESVLPATMKKLANGGKIRILAWGDSVTAGNFLVDKSEQWQKLFADRLRKRFPKAQIELITEAWGGHNSALYLSAPSGSIHNYREKVLDVKPDLIIMEFVNDAVIQGDQLDKQYGAIYDDIKKINAEWIAIVPHYIRPDWMGLGGQKNIDNDPRPYVKSLRQFATKNHIPLADASLRYGRLWRQGIPYNTLMQNNVNHPDPRGMKIIADSLMELFP